METINEKYRLLLVEDEEDFREVITAMLNDDGYECIGAPNGIEAQKRLAEQNFDLIITDNQMPLMTGLSLLSWCRNSHLSLPAILLSGDFFSLETLNDLRQTLQIQILSKPSSIERISEAIFDALQNSCKCFNRPSN